MMDDHMKRSLWSLPLHVDTRILYLVSFNVSQSLLSLLLFKSPFVFFCWHRLRYQVHMCLWLGIVSGSHELIALSDVCKWVGTHSFRRP